MSEDSVGTTFGACVRSRALYRGPHHSVMSDARHFLGNETFRYTFRAWSPLRVQQSEALYLRIESLRSEEQAATQCPEQEETQEPEKASEQEAARGSPAQECGACLKRGRDESGGAPEPVILPAATRQFGRTAASTPCAVHA